MDSNELLTSLNSKNLPQDITNYRASEWYKCRQNPFYFIFNYIYMPIIGGRIKYSPEGTHNKIKRVIRSLYTYHKCVLMASRQLGKSTIAAAIIVWTLIFFARNKAVILNMKQNAGLNNLAIIRFMIKNLPDWMVTTEPFKSKSDIKTYLELFNDSRVDVLYPSTVHDPSTLARSLTVPILYIDESAFIRSMGDIFGSAQPTLSTARQQAIANNYPYFILITSTPNGTQGDGEWFYDRWLNAVESDELFIELENGLEDWNPSIDVNSYVSSPDKNTFIRVYFHWSEDPKKDEQWYQEQCQELSDKRKINQELDLMFVGASSCIFDDETLEQIKDIKPLSHITLPHEAKLRVFEETLDPTDYYIVAADTAESLQGADCAIQVYSFRNFNQVAEVQHRFGSYIYFGRSIHETFQWVYKQVGGRIILIVENNTIGKAPIEYLTMNEEVTKVFDYHPYLYKEKNKDNPYMEQYGIKTTGGTKPLMIGFLVEAMGENINCIRSRNLKTQCSSAFYTNGGLVKFSGRSDLFMATCFAAYARKRKYVEIMPLVAFSNEELNKQQFETVKNIAALSDPKTVIKQDSLREKMLFDEIYDDGGIVTPEVEDNDSGIFFPFFNE